MAKVPRPGYVKTRLRPILSDEQCTELSKCFLLDTVEKADKVSANVVIAFTPGDGEDEVKALLFGKNMYIEQRGTGLGERLESVVAEADKQGFSPLVVIGTDSPTLPAEYIQSAVEHLTANAKGVAIGPTDDGGYYLIGISHPQKRLFSGISWSTSKVFDQTIANASEIPDVNILELPRWYDVDEPADITQLHSEFEKDEKASLRAPETFRWLAANTLSWTTQSKASALRSGSHQRAREGQG